MAADYDADRREIIRRFQIMATSPSVYARSLQLQAGWEDAVASVLAERMGCRTEELAPRLLASSALSAIRSSLRHWIATGQRSSLPELVEGCSDLLGEGLGDVS